jgi:hypothetical protein
VGPSAPGKTTRVAAFGDSTAPATNVRGSRQGGNSGIPRHQLGGVPPKTAPEVDAADEQLPDDVDYAVASDGSSALIRTSWIAVRPVERMLEVLDQLKRFGAFAWATPEGMRRAAEHTDFTGAGPFVRYLVNLRTLAMIGLPPMSAAMIERSGDGLALALRAGNVGDESDRAYPLGPDDLGAAFRALERYTGLVPKQQIRLASTTIRAGTVMVTVPDATLATVFGRAEWDQWKRKPPSPGVASGSAISVSSELTLAERLRIERFFRDQFGLAGTAPSMPLDRSLLELVTEAEADLALLPAIRAELQRPGHAGVITVLNLRAMIDRARYERDRTRLGFDKPAPLGRPVEPFGGFDVPARLTQKGLALAGRPVTFELQLDWDHLVTIGKSSDEITAFKNRDWHAEVEWAFERTDLPAGKPDRKKTEHEREGIKLAHTFRLGPQQPTGTWQVHAFLRTSHFAPKHVTTLIEVKTEDQRMTELREDAMGDLKPEGAMWMNRRFDIGWRHEAVKSMPLDGHDADREGYAITGALPKDWKQRSPEAREASRHEEIERYRKMVDYMKAEQAAGKVGYQTAINAAEDRIKRLVEVDRKVSKEQPHGWRAFELRGTYLSRNAEVPSGPLDLYASVATEMHISRPLRFKVKIRDLTNRIASDLECSGEGEHFDEALERAFVDLCKGYPEGKMTVLGEDHGLDKLAQLAPTGRMIGFELPTTSAWKRVKAKVYDPSVQTLLNAAAMAVMIVFPPAAGIVVPILAVSDIVHNLDDIITRRDQGTLGTSTLMVDLAAIGLDVLPALRSAKFLDSASNRAAQTLDATRPASAGRGWKRWTFDIGNFVGQTLVMTERTRHDLAEIQDRQIGALSERYRKMIELQELRLNDSDPRLVELRAEIEADAKAIRDTVATTWANAVLHHSAMFVGPQLLGHPSAPRRGDASRPGDGDAAHDTDTHPTPPSLYDVDAPPRTVEAGSPAGVRDRSEPRPSAHRDGHGDDSAHAPHDVMPQRIVLAGADAKLRAAAQRAQPRRGYVDVIVHGTADAFWLVRDGVELPVDHRALATYLKKQGLGNSRVRLIACEAGKDRFAVARDLARKLKVDVLAPSTTAWIDGNGHVGVGPRDVNSGSWHMFSWKADGPDSMRGRPGREPYREQEPLRMPDGSELDAPLHVAPPRVDQRARVREAELPALSKQLGARVTIDPELHNGVEVHAVQRKGLLGYDLDAVEIRVGRTALVSDVVAHVQTVRDLRRYNGLLGKLRLLAERMFRQRDPSRPMFPPGTRGHVTEVELGKLEHLIAERQAQHASGLIDGATLADELAFLHGQVAFHTETLQSMADAEYLRDANVTVGGPDIGATTRKAQAEGYKLPGEVKGADGEHANPEHYYYRRARHDAAVFELALKASAPPDAPAYRAKVINGKFTGLVDLATKRDKHIIAVTLPNHEVVATLRKTEGFGPYAEMLERHGIASRAVIDAAVTTTRGRKNQSGDEVTLDWLRHEVKDYFRKRVEAKLLDPSLDDAASFRNMRAMLDGLGNADRGNLVEVWHHQRDARDGTAHRKHSVLRTSGENEGQIETRVSDLVVGREAREVKDIEGKIDAEQLGAYLDILRDDKLRESTGIDRVRYVFTKPEGAIANLESLASSMTDKQLAGRVTVEVFDKGGVRHVATTSKATRVLLAKLKDER